MKILIVKTSSLGDMIHSFGALDYLRNRFPKAQIDWVAEKPFAELVKAHPQIDQVVVFESKKWGKSLFSQETRQQIKSFRKKLRESRYDLLFDLQGNLKSGLIVALARARKKIGFGWKTVAEWPNALFTNRKINPVKGKISGKIISQLCKVIFTIAPPIPSSLSRSSSIRYNNKSSQLFFHVIDRQLLYALQRRGKISVYLKRP